MFSPRGLTFIPRGVPRTETGRPGPRYPSPRDRAPVASPLRSHPPAMLQQACRQTSPLVSSPAPLPLPRRIVALGGGTGLPAVLRSLRLLFDGAIPPDAITAIVAVSDDGGSSGWLRRNLNILPPGDVRNCVAALANEASPLARLLQHRLTGDRELGGHAVGNLLLAALTQQMDGDFASAVQALGRLVGIQGRVLPATAQSVHVRAEFDGGDVVVGETAIAAQRRPIRRLSLERHVRPLPEAIEALVNADLVIVGPGSLYTSILPVLLVDGIAPTLYGLNARKVYVANLMTEPGETDGYSVEDHVDAIERHVGLRLFDHVLVNSTPIPVTSRARYARNCAEPVRRTPGAAASRARFVECPLAWEIEDGKLRHDPRPLGTALMRVMRDRRVPDHEENAVPAS